MPEANRTLPATSAARSIDMARSLTASAFEHRELQTPGAINMRRLILLPIPFAEAVLSRLGRRGAALDLIEEIEDEAVESLTAADLLSAQERRGGDSGDIGAVAADMAGRRRPPVAEPKTRAKSVASPVSAVMAAIHLPTSRFARWRNRHLT